MNNEMIKNSLYMEIFASLIACNEQKKINDTFKSSIIKLEKKLDTIEREFYINKKDIHEDSFDKIVISYLEFRGFKTKNFKNLIMGLNQVLYDYEFKASTSYFYFDEYGELVKEAKRFLPKNLEPFSMFNDLLKNKYDDMDDLDVFDEDDEDDKDDEDDEDFEIDDEATRILHLEQRRSSNFSLILHVFWNTRFKKLKKFHINYARYKEYIKNRLEDENANSNRFNYYDLKSLKIHKDIKLYDLYKEKLDDYVTLYDNYEKQVKSIQKKIYAEKVKHDQYVKNIESVYKTLVIIPLYYSKNLDAVEKMMFLYINKRADNIKELINLYEETEWRGSLLDSVNSLTQTINDNTQLMLNEMQNLGDKLDQLRSEMSSQSIATLNAIFNMTEAISDTKINIENKVEISIE